MPHLLFLFSFLLSSLSLDPTLYPSQKNITLYTPNSFCNCGGGQVSIYPYESIPISTSGAGCIGGCDGTPFEFHDYATTVSVLRAWTGGSSDGIHALDIELFNGRRQTFGQAPGTGPSATIQFALGEMIVGDIELCGNGVGTRLGFIRFTTSAGQKFQVGEEHATYYFPSGNSFLVGFFGQSGSDINHLGLLMMKSVTSGQLTNVKYPTLNVYTEGLSPKEYKSTLCNDDKSQSQTQSVSFTKTVGESYTWTLSASIAISGSISVSAGIPLIAHVSEELRWDVGITASYSRTVDTTKTETTSFPVTVPPRERIFATFSWWDSLCHVPYTANMYYTFSDRSNYTFPISDAYTGAYITSVIGDYHSVPLQANESCSTVF